jgi:hypothetical protein
MRIDRLTDRPQAPEVTIVLLDWAVRESFHTLEYLSHQRCARGAFEVIWIEYYDRRPPALAALVARHRRLGLPPPIDAWIVLQRSDAECYHKHRMYNVGLLNARGPIVCILDSDAVVRSDFIATVREAFARRGNLALHFEQIRNFRRRYYPFCYPTIAEITGDGCVNATGGVPDGFRTCAKSLREDPNLWHVYNYGACLAARRDDLVRIGGADEHGDYLGYICGPYEMTARLINAGVPDLLHPTHYLYHTYHPCQGGGGARDHCGPHNGRGMSTTATQILETGRVLPLVENPRIRRLRLGARGPQAVSA